MSDTLAAELQAALGGAYLIERELGGGGMSRVFVATEAALGRRVVIKVLAPELSRGVSAERFRREIQVAAALHHPHIVPLLTAGQAGSLVYYTMPYVEGESLRARLTREGELPLPDAIEITRCLVRALGYAHRHGIVHRDVKPENVLLEDGQAVVADFGISKAVAASSTSDGLTSVGVALGTPVYMAPEQAAADPTADHRVDLYALGVVVYEMLAGQPPFAGRTAQQLAAAHATEDPVPLGRRREVSPALAALVARLLAKRAADRPQHAEEVLAGLDAIATPAPGLTPTVATPAAAHRGRWMVAGGVMALAIVVSLASRGTDDRPRALDRNVVAIAPFRVTGADSSLGYLREGIVDLLAAKLSGTAGLRPTDSRTLLSQWSRVSGPNRDLGEDEALGVAAWAGAGRIVQGEIVGGGSRLSLTARILEVPGGAVKARANAEGPSDSLTHMVDRLAASLLALDAGEGEQRLAGLTSTSLPALRAYLNGEALVRRGEFDRAGEQFDEALRLDSTFALAALAAARAGEWHKGSAEPARVAWRLRDRLSQRDRAYLDLYVGPRFPATSGARDAIEAAERFVEVAPDSPDAWYKLADNLFHYGPLIGLRDAHPRAATAFGRSLALDSSYAPTLQHLSEVATALNDTPGVRRGRDLLRRIDSTSGIAAARRWHVAAFLGDTAEIRRSLESDSILAYGPGYVLFYSLDAPLDLRGTEALYPRALAAAATSQERGWGEMVANRYELVRGRPTQATPLPAWLPERLRGQVVLLDYLYADGDSALAARAARAFEGDVGAPLAAGDWQAVGVRYAVGQYGLHTGRLEIARRAAADLVRAKAAADSAWQTEGSRAYALLLHAQLDALDRSLEAPRLLGRLDSVLNNPPEPQAGGLTGFHVPANLVAARLHEESGDLSGALAALRRRFIGVATYPQHVRYLREEGRLAALVGDRAGAIRAYRHYLALRSDPEARLRPEADAVRHELAALLKEPTDK